MELKEARQIIEAWRREYNNSRPHASLEDRTPSEFASQCEASGALTETQTGRRLTPGLVQKLRDLQRCATLTIPLVQNFGQARVIAVTQAMLPFLRESPAGRIVNMGSSVGPLTLNAARVLPTAISLVQPTARREPLSAPPRSHLRARENQYQG